MVRLMIGGMVLAGALVAAGCGQQPATERQVASPTPAATATPVLAGRIGPAGGPGAATALRANPHCEAAGTRAAVADLSWTAAPERGTQERVALTKFADGFESGSFETSPPLSADASGFGWRGLNPGGVQFWRVLTLHGDVWTPSAVASFTGPTCVADYTSPSPGR